MKNLKTESLKFIIEERIRYKRSLVFGELVRLTLIPNKPIPPATHGTVRLKGKQN
ncbi:hypothetical protein [Bacillus sp. J33]|uniref:hypothetical protein n=1 Tax=Bacillus sp. J33 TaxID=935836 RepID=UPI0012FC4BF3|nr:hypothetical protein [Bacillus sp. J33]